MPVYEYVCPQCRKKFRKLIGMIASTSLIACPNCNNPDVTRLISRFAKVRSEDDTLDSLSEEMELAGEDDPKAMRRLMKDVGAAMGEDLDDEFEQMMEEDSSGAGDGGSEGDAN